MAESKTIQSLKQFAIADDDGDDADLFAEALSSIDPDIILNKYSNGRQLLEKIESGALDSTDIIFLDINMPEMNGWECLTKLKRESKLSSVPVIIYSTSSSAQDKKMAKILGATHFLTKPDNYQQLKKFLNELINDPETILNTKAQ